MNKMHRVLIPLSVLVLAACGEPASSGAHSDASSGGSVESSSSPILSSDGSGGGSDTSETSVDVGDGFAGIVRIYFHNDTGTERNKRIYIWCDGVDGTEFDWTGYDNAIGAYKDVDIREAPYAGHIANSLSFIIKEPGTWAGQSADTVVKFDDYLDAVTTTDDGTPLMNVYSCPGEGNIVEAYPDKTDALGDSFKSFGANSDWKTLVAIGSGDISEVAVYAFDEEYFKMNVYQRNEAMESYRIPESNVKLSGAKVTITAPGGVDPQKTYRISGKFKSNLNKTKKKVASFDKLYDTSKFRSDYTYTGNDLGVTYSKAKSEFRLWAPTSTRVRLNIYDEGTPSAYTENPKAHALNDYPSATYVLKAQKGGIFSGTVEEDLAGKYYTYTLFYNESAFEVIDPYATACGVNGIRGAIVDFSATNPEGWDKMKFATNIKNPNNLTVYEVHVRDLTADKTWVSNKGNENGTYNAFAEEGTTYGGVTTGLDHLKELGINAVQLLPVFDQDNDERTIETEINGEKVVTKPGYNWGYNPQNYNCVEGSYSSDPYIAETRIKEYKNLISTLAKNDIRVIMDVVYNHVSSVTKNAFSTTCPRYFFRYDKDMNLVDDSGCGNCTNTDRPMMSKFVVDSCKFWAKEYNVKGFRFDLMGVLDTGTMRKVKDELYKIDPSIVVYGEGWTGGSTSSSSPAKTNDVYSKLGDNGKGVVGCFNDAGRDGTKGNTTWADVTPSGGWISEASNIDNVYNALTQIIGENRWAKEALGIKTMDPNQTVNYLACHDNYTLYDQINYLFYNHDKTFGDGTHEYVMQAAVAVSALSLFSQGIGFVHGGDEFFRQKLCSSDDPNFAALKESYKHATNGKDNWIEGDGIEINKDLWLVRNSYKYGDAVNSFKWDRKSNSKVKKHYEAFRDAIQLRKKEMGNALGQTAKQIAAGGTTCWSYDDLFDGDGKPKTDLLAGHYKGQKDSKAVYIFTNKGNGAASIGIGNGTMEVLYSSTGDHKVGSKITISDNKITGAKFETLIVRQVA